MDVSNFGAPMTMIEAEQLDPDSTSFPSCDNATDILLFNFSQYDYPGDGGGPWPPPLGLISALKIIFSVINMIVSILGNCAVIIAVYHNPALRSTINFYLVNSFFLFLIFSYERIWGRGHDFQSRVILFIYSYSFFAIRYGRRNGSPNCIRFPGAYTYIYSFYLEISISVFFYFRRRERVFRGNG